MNTPPSVRIARVVALVSLLGGLAGCAAPPGIADSGADGGGSCPSIDPLGGPSPSTCAPGTPPCDIAAACMLCAGPDHYTRFDVRCECRDGRWQCNHPDCLTPNTWPGTFTDSMCTVPYRADGGDAGARDGN